ncbi:MAG: fumarate hydratase [Eubacteriales bacterium]|nr:fumarate hydratase [Clostridiales bacterium]
MREITASQIKDTIKTLFININYEIGDNVLSSLKCALDREVSPVGKAILSQIIENDIIAKNERVAMCQDTGMAVVFAEVGQDVHITGGNFVDAINQGVREAYSEGCLRKSIVADPLFDRKNTGDNTPAVIYTDIVPGDKIKLTVTCKGFGSENMSRIKMMTPADGVDGVLDFIVNTVVEAGPNPCPPTIVGVCIGGTMDKAAQIAKLATIRPVGSHNSDPRYAQLEAEALRRINDSGVGPGGLGGRVTCLAVNIESYPTHIAGMPVAVNVCCHAARHGEAVI